MVVDSVWQVQIQLVDCERRLSTDSVPTNFKIVIDFADMVVASISSLLNHRSHIEMKSVDKTTLSTVFGLFYCACPESKESM